MFTIQNKRKQFWQWDMGQRLIVNADLCSEVHFCNGTSDCSLVCEVYEEDGLRLVNVPNILLQVPKAIKAFVYICDGDEAYTQLQKIFPVFPRSKPADYSYTEVEIIRYETLEARISKLEKNGVGGSGAPGLVFDTVADMEAYIAESADTLAVGQNLYIRAEDVPDFWWDGTQASPVEGKTDLSDYVTTEQLAKEIDGKVDYAVENALTEAKKSGDFDGEPGITPHIGANKNWYIGETDTGVRAQGQPGASGNAIYRSTELHPEMGSDVVHLDIAWIDTLDRTLQRNDFVILGTYIYRIDGFDGVNTIGYLMFNMAGAPGAPGRNGDDYILTDADKTEIAQQAAGLVDTALLAIIGEVE